MMEQLRERMTWISVFLPSKARSGPHLFQARAVWHADNEDSPDFWTLSVHGQLVKKLIDRSEFSGALRLLDSYSYVTSHKSCRPRGASKLPTQVLQVVKPIDGSNHLLLQGRARIPRIMGLPRWETVPTSQIGIVSRNAGRGSCPAM
jgi:hypothetical protein